MLFASRLAMLAAVSAACGCGGPSGAAAPDSGAIAGGGVAFFGQVSVVYEMTSSGSSGGLSATFQRATSAACTQRTVGACDVVRCDMADGGALPLTNVSAGTITFAGTASSAMIAPAGDGSYSSGGNLPAYAAGDSITVSASGATIPAFSTHVVFGSPVTVTAPGPTGAPVIDHTKDLAIAWTGGGASSLVVSISEGVTDRAVIIACVFDGAGGSATVPASAVSDLEVATLGSGANQGDFSIFSAGVSDVTPGGFPILVFAGPSVFSALPTIQ